MIVYSVYFDGSCFPNPGGICKYGWFVKKNGEKIAGGHGQIFDEPRTNNVAEITAACIALEWCSWLTDANEIQVFGDSKCAMSWLTSWKSKKSWINLILDKYAQMWTRLDNVNLKWIPREENEEADYLSKL